MTKNNSTDGLISAILTIRTGNGTVFHDQIVIVDQMEAMRLKMIYGDDFYDLKELLNDDASTPPQSEPER